jgi:hypothetical protein
MTHDQLAAMGTQTNPIGDRFGTQGANRIEIAKQYSRPLICHRTPDTADVRREHRVAARRKRLQDKPLVIVTPTTRNKHPGLGVCCPAMRRSLRNLISGAKLTLSGCGLQELTSDRPIRIQCQKKQTVT